MKALTAGVRSFSKVGAYKPAHQFLSLLGLEYTHLHIQWYVKWRWTHTTHGLHHPIFVSKDMVHMLLWWSDRWHLSQRMLFMSPNTTITVTTDVSMEGWGGHCIVPRSVTVLYSDLWTRDECQLHINVLELRAV